MEDPIDAERPMRDLHVHRMLNRLSTRNLLINVIYHGVTVVSLPATCLAIESMIGPTRHPTLGARIIRAALALQGAAL